MTLFKWFRRSAVARNLAGEQEALLNEGLALAMEWGQDWGKPIQERLHIRHPHLTPIQLDDLNAKCRDAMFFGHGVVWDTGVRHASEETFSRIFKARFPWADDRNISALFNQSMYYTWKDNGLD